jgi:biopolymer transport protein ExbB/TolQ
VGFLVFIKDVFASLGSLAIPLFIAVSIVFIVIIERIIFYTFIFKIEKAFSVIKDVIINNKAYPKILREDLVDLSLEDFSRSLDFGLSLLKFIAGIATMLGLLGTVIGMIDVFSAISGVKTAVSPAVISVGIKKAMFTTAYGLVIGIFALFTHYIFENISKRIFLKLEEYAILLNATTEYERLSKLSRNQP